VKKRSSERNAPKSTLELNDFDPETASDCPLKKRKPNISPSCDRVISDSESDLTDLTTLSDIISWNANDEATASSDDLTGTFESLRDRLKASKKEVQLLREQQDENYTRISFLSSRLCEAEERNNNYQEELKSLRRANLKLVENVSLYNQLELQITENQKLQRKWEANNERYRFTMFTSSDPILRDKSQRIRDNMSNINNILVNQLLFDHEDIDTPSPVSLESNEHLVPLVQRVLRIDSQVQVTTDTISTHFSSLSLQAVVRTLTAAAVCLWVFEDDFFGAILKSSMLLDEYKNHITTIGTSSPLLFLAPRSSVLTFFRHIILTVCELICT
jgi:hypothetical protein